MHYTLALIRKAGQVAILVGITLNLVNHGATLVRGASPPWGGVVLNFIIPFCVSLYSGA
jgi:hypothetical protein